MLKFIAIGKRILFDALGHYNDDDGWAMASHVALSSLMALFPFLIFAATLASVLGADAFSDTAVHLIFDTWPEKIAAPIAAEVQNVLTVPHGGLATLSFLAAFYFASSGIEALRLALNRAYRVKESRRLFFLRAQSFGFVLVAAFGMLAISFLLVLAPLVITVLQKYVPGIEPYLGTIQFWRFLIDARFQGRRVGVQAMRLLALRLQELGETELELSFGDARGGPEAFYTKLGFVRTGDIDDGELVARARIETILERSLRRRADRRGDQSLRCAISTAQQAK